MLLLETVDAYQVMAVAIAAMAAAVAAVVAAAVAIALAGTAAVGAAAAKGQGCHCMYFRCVLWPATPVMWPWAQRGWAEPVVLGCGSSG